MGRLSREAQRLHRGHQRDTLSGVFAVGDEVICSLVPTDGLDDGAAVTASLFIENSPPEVASATLSPAAPVEGDTLLCTPGSTTDADGTTALTYTYGWEVNGTTASATGPALGSEHFARGDTVRCAISASDGLDSSTVTWSSAVTVLGSVSLSPSLFYTSDTLLASAVATDADGDTVSYTYSWVVNGSPVAPTGNTLDGGWFDKGDTVYVSVTASDGSGSSASVVSSGRWQRTPTT